MYNTIYDLKLENTIFLTAILFQSVLKKTGFSLKLALSNSMWQRCCHVVLVIPNFDYFVSVRKATLVSVNHTKYFLKRDIL